MTYKPSGFNQDEIDSWDQLNWRQERDTIYQGIRNWSKQNSIYLANGDGYSFSVDGLLEKTSSEKIIYTQLFDLIPAKDSWVKISSDCEKTGQKIFVITDNFVDHIPLPNVKFFFIKEYIGVTSSYGNQYLDNVEKTKLFNCFMQRVDSVRQSWFYFLKDRGLFEKGYISFLLKQMVSYAGSKTGVELYDYIHKQYQLYNLPHFDQAYNDLRSLVPYRNFNEEYNLLPLILESKYSLVIETFAVEDDVGAWCWTEKSLRDLQLPVLTLPFWQKKSAEKLSNLGFELPNYVWDFDNDSWQERQQKILHILENDSIMYNYNECFDRAVHNRQLLASWKNTYQQPNFLDPVYEEILST